MPERGGGRAARPSEVGLRCPSDVAVAAAETRTSVGLVGAGYGGYRAVGGGEPPVSPLVSWPSQPALRRGWQRWGWERYQSTRVPRWESTRPFLGAGQSAGGGGCGEGAGGAKEIRTLFLVEEMVSVLPESGSVSVEAPPRGPAPAPGPLAPSLPAILTRPRRPASPR